MWKCTFDGCNATSDQPFADGWADLAIGDQASKTGFTVKPTRMRWRRCLRMVACLKSKAQQWATEETLTKSSDQSSDQTSQHCI
jgi:hypothetical protein